MDWYIVDKSYVQYLQSFDAKVGNVNYGDRLKLHIGILTRVNSCNYYVPISSPKKKHFKMKNNVDFHKLVDSKSKHLYAVVNLNNMIPVPDQCVTRLSYKNLQNLRPFLDDEECLKYIFLLQQEKFCIDRDCGEITAKATKLYDIVDKYPDSPIAKRCCNYKLLESKLREWGT